MAVHRIHKTENYTVMSNVIFKDKRLSYKAKGLHAMMMSLPDYWDYSTEGLVTLSTDGSASVRSALQELETCGYLIRTRIKDESGKFTDVVYDIYEIPQLDRPQVENPHVGNQPQLNTKVLNTKESIHTANKESKSKSSKLSKQDFLTMCREKFEDEEVIELLVAWNENRNLSKKPLTKRALEIALNKLEDCAIQSRLSLTSYLEEVIVKGWLTFYPITNKKPTEQVEHIEYV